MSTERITPVVDEVVEEITVNSEDLHIEFQMEAYTSKITVPSKRQDVNILELWKELAKLGIKIAISYREEIVDMIGKIAS